MRWLNKLALSGLLTGAAIGLGVPQVRANAFNNRDVSASLHMEYDWHVMNIYATQIADSLEKEVDRLRIKMQELENKYPEISSIALILSSGGPMDRIGPMPNGAGGNSTPSTTLAPIMDIFNRDNSGLITGVKLKEPYRSVSVKRFGSDATAELEAALSTLFTNGADVCRVVYKGPGGEVMSSNEPSPYPPWLDSLDGKYVYMLVMILLDARGIAHDLVGGYVHQYKSLYKEILWNLYKLQCAGKAIGLAEWLEKYADNPDIPETEKMRRAQELLNLLDLLRLR